MKGRYILRHKEKQAALPLRKMSRFVSAGTDEAPTERDEAWKRAQQQIDATKQPKLRPGEQEGGKSLYETLQANKGDLTMSSSHHAMPS